VAGGPPVCAAVGVEGLGRDHGEHVLVGHDAAWFATAMTRLLGERRLWSRLAAKGRAHVARGHGLEAVRAALLEALEAVQEREPKPTILPPGSRDRLNCRILYQ